MSAIVVNKASKSYYDEIVLNSLSLSVENNEIYALLGAKSSGKTSLFYTLMGELKLDKGSAGILGFDCHKQRKDMLKNAFFLEETPYFPPGESIYKYTELLHSLRHSDNLEKTFSISEKFEVPKRRKFFGLRSDEMKMFALAFALSLDAKVLVLDSPFSYITKEAANKLKELLMLAKEDGKTIFYSCEKLSEVRGFADRAGLFRSGNILLEKSKEELEAYKNKVYDISFKSKSDAMEFAESWGSDAEVMGEKVLVSVPQSPQRLIKTLAHFDVEELTSLNEEQAANFIATMGGEFV